MKKAFWGVPALPGRNIKIMAFPLAWKIVSIALTKKVVVYTLGRVRSFVQALPAQQVYNNYLSCPLLLQMYGYPRLYRRFLEVNKRRAVDRLQKKALEEKVKYFFRVPNQLWTLLW